MNLVKVRPNVRRRQPVFVNNSFDHLFNQLWNTTTAPQKTAKQRPAVNILETEANFRIDLAAPGLGKDDFTIQVENDTLKISAKKEQITKEGEKFTRREFSYVAFERSFHLPETIDTNQITATTKNGVLTVTLAKKEEAKELPARKIEIG